MGIGVLAEARTPRSTFAENSTFHFGGLSLNAGCEESTRFSDATLLLSLTSSVGSRSAVGSKSSRNQAMVVQVPEVGGEPPGERFVLDLQSDFDVPLLPRLGEVC